MARKSVKATGVERTFDKSEVIVSKTDKKGNITYANEVFIKVAGYSEAELVGQPHSIIRHCDMPRCIFKLLWETLEAGNEIFAYVINLCKNGDHYWVFAQIAPSFDSAGSIIGYHSSRRVPDPQKLEIIKILYAQLLEQENKFDNRKEGMQSSFQMVLNILNEKGVGYDEFILSL